MAEKSRLLIVSAFYAPNREVGAKRFTKLSELLLKRGYEINILTTPVSSSGDTDPTLPVSGTVFRSAPLLPLPSTRKSLIGRLYNRLLWRYLQVPDPYLAWVPTAVRQGLRIVRDRQIDLIVATTPPYSALVIGALLNRMTGAALVLDYRDPWTARDWRGVRGRGWISRLNARMEGAIVAHAAAVVVVTEVMHAAFQARFGASTNAPLYLITNGYHDNARVAPLKAGADDRVSIVYAGSLYGERRISIIAAPLADLVRERRLGPTDVSIHVFGRGVSAEEEERLDALDLPGVLVRHQTVDYETMLRYLKGANILYLVCGHDVSYALPFKLFDYLSVRVPVLAVGPRHSAISQFMREVDCGEMADIDDPVSIRRALLNLLVVRKTYSFSGAERFTWDAVASRYMDAIDAAAGHQADARTTVRG